MSYKELTSRNVTNKKQITRDEIRSLQFLAEAGRRAIVEKYKGDMRTLDAGGYYVEWREAAAIQNEEK